MVFDTLIRILLFIPKELLQAAPELEIGSIPLPDNFESSLAAMVSTAKNFFPCELLVFITSTMFELRLLRAQNSLQRRIVSMFPFMNG